MTRAEEWRIDNPIAHMVKYQAAEVPSAAHAPVVELADTMDLGDVTLVKGFCAILAADILR